MMEITDLQSSRAAAPVNMVRPVNSIVAQIRRVAATMSAQFHVSRRKSRMELVDRLELGNKRQLILVTCDNRQYLVGLGADTVCAITQVKGAIKDPTAVEPKSL